jgi:hypothetical protein
LEEQIYISPTSITIEEWFLGFGNEGWFWFWSYEDLEDDEDEEQEAYKRVSARASRIFFNVVFGVDNKFF